MNDEHFINELVKMLKSHAIKLSDVPKKHKEEVCKRAFGKYPLKSFADLKAITKNQGT